MFMRQNWPFFLLNNTKGGQRLCCTALKSSAHTSPAKPGPPLTKSRQAPAQNSRPATHPSSTSLQSTHCTSHCQQHTLLSQSLRTVPNRHPGRAQPPPHHPHPHLLPLPADRVRTAEQLSCSRRDPEKGSTDAALKPSFMTHFASGALQLPQHPSTQQQANPRCSL